MRQAILKLAVSFLTLHGQLMPSNKTFSSLSLVSGAGLEPRMPSPEILPKHPCELCFRTSSLSNFEQIFMVLLH